MASFPRNAFPRNALLTTALSALALTTSALAAAEEEPALARYGFKGFFSGAQVGLAAGFLATGSDYESREWRTLVFGAGVGALGGVGVGLTLAALDLGRTAPLPGWVILRDTGYGASLGTVVGAAVGALFVLDSGEAKDILTGAAWGTLGGAVVGAGFGLLENAIAKRPAPSEQKPTAGMKLHFTLVGTEGSLVPLPAIGGTF
jgi:hypothetical protein